MGFSYWRTVIFKRYYQTTVDYFGNQDICGKPHHKKYVLDKKKKNRTFQDFQWFPMLCCGPKSEPPMFFVYLLRVLPKRPAPGKPVEIMEVKLFQGTQDLCLLHLKPHGDISFTYHKQKNVSYLSLRNCRPWNQKLYIYTLHIYVNILLY